MSGSLYKQYKDWIDWDEFKGLSYDEQEALEEENRKKYGLNHVLREGAPESAVEAWKRDAEMSKRKDETGVIVD